MTHVLLLNACFSPLRLISTKRAVCLILAEKAELIEEKPGRLRSESLDIAQPCVVRLRHYVQIPFRATVPLNRRTLMARDRGQCQFAGCDKPGTTIDHLIPRSRGGRHEWGNVVACCASQNFQKADNTLEEMGWSLKRPPHVPRGSMWLLIGMHMENDVDPQWEAYLTPALAS